MLVAMALRASHPPAGATTLLVTLGSIKLEDALTIIVGVLVVAAAGELARRMRLGQLTPRKENQEERLPAPKPQSKPI
jgi:hypothetical protein